MCHNKECAYTQRHVNYAQKSTGVVAVGLHAAVFLLVLICSPSRLQRPLRRAPAL